MLKVADAIEKRQVATTKVGFNMNSYVGDGGTRNAQDANGSWCGTTACVAGFATLINQVELVVDEEQCDWEPHEIGREYLGLSHMQANDLFLDAVDLFNEKNTLVPDALRYMAMTGKVNWREAIEASACLARDRKNKKQLK